MTNMPPTTPARVRHATTWGRPQRERSPRFYKLFGRIFEKAANGCRYVSYVSIVVSLALAIYTAFAVEKHALHASDGSMFSCQLQTYR